MFSFFWLSFLLVLASERHHILHVIVDVYTSFNPFRLTASQSHSQTKCGVIILIRIVLNEAANRRVDCSCSLHYNRIKCPVAFWSILFHCECTSSNPPLIRFCLIYDPRAVCASCRAIHVTSTRKEGTELTHHLLSL